MKTRIFCYAIALVLFFGGLSIPVEYVYADDDTSDIYLDAPQNTAVELKTDEDGNQYFEVSWTNPQNIIDIYNLFDQYGAAPLSFQIDMKVGNGKWNYDIIGDALPGNSLHSSEIVNCAYYDPIATGDTDKVNVQNNKYYFRVRYYYFYSDEQGEHYIYSPFSNIASIGMGTYFHEASSWALPELDKAESYGLIINSIEGKMNSPITREEFAELAVRLVEVYTGMTPKAAPKDTFTDTTNEQVLKAYACGIVNGVGEGKFSPEAITNREQLATMVGRTIRLIAPEIDTSYPDTAMFSDESDIAEYFIPYVKFMAQKGFIKGTDGKFLPKQNCTREQAVLIIVRVYESLMGISENKTNGTESKSSLIGTWSSEGPQGEILDSSGNLIDTYYSGTYYAFRSDGTFRYIIGGSGQFISGLVYRSGAYTCSGDKIYLTNIKENWYPWEGDNSGTGKYTDKSVDDIVLQYKFVDADTIKIDEGYSMYETFYRIE